jgi:hypothetical protein
MLDQKEIWTTPQEVRVAAEAGDVEAQYNLGVMYDQGLGARQDYGEAAKWYRKSAEQGFPDAQFNLGAMHYSGQGVPKDPSEAARWYARAAQQGFANAQLSLGDLYARGQGVRLDLVNAYKWVSIAESNGNQGGQQFLDALDNHLTTTQKDFAAGLVNEWQVTSEVDTNHPSVARARKLVDATEFQAFMSGGISNDNTQQKACECFSQQRRADLSAPITQGPHGWDCPVGWFGICRLDKQISSSTSGVETWMMLGAGLVGIGSTPARHFKIQIFKGELGPNGEALPLSPNVRQ